jgi:probable rRNA maturation factor
MAPDGSISLLISTRRPLRQRALREFLGKVTEQVLKGREVSCLITTDAGIRKLNRRYRGKDHATDILSFPANFSQKAQPVSVAGDLAISLDRAEAQAGEHGHTTHDELCILMLHGALHLAGMDHEKDTGEMARAEVRWRKRLQLPVGLIERTRGPG